MDAGELKPTDRSEESEAGRGEARFTTAVPPMPPQGMGPGAVQVWQHTFWDCNGA